MQTRNGGSISPHRRYSPHNRGKRSGSSIRILVTGASGLLGTRIVELGLKKGHDVVSGYKDHVPLDGKPMVIDLTHSAKVRKALSGVHLDVVINVAAMTDVDRAKWSPMPLSRLTERCGF